MYGFHIVVYFGRDGQILNIPIMYLSIIGCLPTIRPLIGSRQIEQNELYL